MRPFTSLASSFIRLFRKVFMS